MVFTVDFTVTVRLATSLLVVFRLAMGPEAGG